MIYLDGNSLGMMPRRTLERLTEVLRDDWATGLIRSWDHWVDLPQRVGDVLAPLIGAAPGEVVLHDNTTLNVYQLVHAAIALAARPDVSSRSAPTTSPPTATWSTASPRARAYTVRHGFDDLDDVAVVVRSVIDYRTAELVDVAAETARAHAAGALVVWDLSHAAGVLSTSTSRAGGAQLAVGCTLQVPQRRAGRAGVQLRGPRAARHDAASRSGAGSPARTSSRWGRRSSRARHRAACCWARRRSSPSPPPRWASRCRAEAGMAAIHAKARRSPALAFDLCDQFGLRSTTPRDPARRGNHVAVQHPNAGALVDELAGTT